MTQVSFICKSKNMPKVKDEYLQDKRGQILEAAHRVCMRKPVYSITMRDIIAETGWSQGAIYRYYKNVHLILFALINRQTAGLNVKEETDRILALPVAPEHIVAEILDLVTRTTMMNSEEFGKMIFEYAALIADHPELNELFYKNVKIASDLQYLQNKTFEFLVSRVDDGYFKPLMPVGEIFSFVGMTIDGIERDLTLTRNCSFDTPVFDKIDPQKLMNVLCKSLIYLLGGDPAKAM
jgi:AcrR family transcriptional regulator